MNDKQKILELQVRNDKTFILLSGLYDWINSVHPEMIAELPYGLNAQILYMLGDIEYNEVETWDDSIVTAFVAELTEIHETCIITGCNICSGLRTYEQWRQSR